jgi:penicillin-binding protein 1A
MRGPFPSVPSIVLGAVEATPFELTTAYATLATLGRRPQPRLVTRVLDAEGNVVWEQPPIATAALDPSVAFMVNEMLKDVVDFGTAMPLRDVGYRGVVAGKTGTSNGSVDLWFVGYTPQIVGTIWIGFDQPRTIVPGGESGAIAAPIWGRIMKRVGDTGPDWKVPPGIIVRRVDASGRAFAEHCAGAHGRAEYFLVRPAPAAGCP